MLTPEQQSAINHVNGPLLVIAGPGAGKTRVIVEKCVYLINETGKKPENLLVTTFTNKARDELYDRLYVKLGNDAQKITISTIHSFCQTLLTAYPAQNPLGAHFEVLDGEEQFLLVYDNLKQLGLAAFPKKRVADFIHSIITTFNLCTEECVDPDRFIEEAKKNGKELLGLKATTDDAIEEYCAVTEAYKKYKKLLFDERLVDFPTLQETAYKMVKGKAEVRKELAAKYHYILIDEYQDTNRLQVLIFKEIAEPEYNLCAVGDDDQSIYRFRGANVKSFLNFKNDFPKAKEITLTANFRSTPIIVEATSSLIEKNVPEHKTKELISYRKCCSVAPVNFHEPTAPEEAAAIVSALDIWKKKKIIKSWNEVAILLRSVKSYSEPYITELKKWKIPFMAFGEGAFFEREDISGIRDLLLFCGYKNKCPVSGIRPPLFEISRKTLKILEEWKDDPVSWSKADTLEALHIPKNDRVVLNQLSHLRQRSLDGEYRHYLLGLFYDMLDISGYFRRVLKEYVEQQNEYADAALYNLSVFSNLIGQFQKRVRSGSLYKLNEYFYFIQDKVVDAIAVEPCGEAVRIMTVHQAKGLEFPVVVIGGAMEKRFPSGFRTPKYPVPAELKISKNRDDEEIHIRDERRLFYVGMTRAEDILFIGSADKVNVRGSGPSRFIEEIKKDKIIQSVKDIKDRPCRDEEKTRAPERKRISYSGLHTYLLCPLQYKLIYECDFAVPQVYWAYFGGAVHSLLEHIHKKALEGHILQTKELPELWKTMWKPPESWDEKRRDTMGKTGLAYLERYVSNYAERLKRVYWVEQQIEIPIMETNLLLTGRLDLACKSDGGIEIIDFKIRKRTGLEVMREGLQVQIYALAAATIRMENVNGVTLHLLGEDRGNEIQKYPWNDSVKESVQKTIQLAGEGITKRKFDAQPGIHCRFCDFRSLCPFSIAPAKKEELDDEIALGTEAQKVG